MNNDEILDKAQNDKEEIPVKIQVQTKSPMFELGFTQKQEKIYQSLLQLGRGTVIEISSLAGTKRPTTYDTLAELIQLGLASEIYEGKKHYYLAESPDQLEALLKERQRGLEEALPYLRSIYNAGGEKPNVAYFPGFEGIEHVCKDILKMPEGSVVLGYVTAKELGHPKILFFLDWFVQERVRKRIKFKGIYNTSVQMKKELENSDDELREYRLVSTEEFPFDDEINIYGNKIAIMSYGQRPFGVIIESKSVADTQRSIFKLVWRSLEPNF